MAITVPVPGLGSVTVLVNQTDFAEFECSNFDEGVELVEVPAGTLLAFSCADGISANLVAYLANFEQLNLIEVITAILQLQVRVETSNAAVTRIQPLNIN